MIVAEVVVASGGVNNVVDELVVSWVAVVFVSPVEVFNVAVKSW